MLEHQESFLRDFYPNLLVSLPKIACSLKDCILSKLAINSLETVEIIGKVAMASHSNELAETDILLQNKEQTYYLSVKLGKSNSFLNTKSAGVKSFLSKYFFQFEEIAFYQGQFCQFFDQSFDEFAFHIHDLAHISYEGNFHNWTKEGYTVLPGELEGDYRDAYLDFTHKVAHKLYDILNELFKINTLKFFDSLAPLLGFSNKDIIQVSTYYKKDNDNYILDKHRVDIFDSNLKLIDIEKKKSVNYINIKLNNCILQIRLKAMNKFSNRGFKINCSVKYLS
jgi:hypothetical protein